MGYTEIFTTLLYYGFVMVGSISFGYLVLRLSYPDVRLFTKERKLGASAVIGFLLVLASILIDYSIDGNAVVTPNGFLPLIFFLLVSLVLAISRVYFMTRKSEYIQVAIPVKDDTVEEKKEEVLPPEIKGDEVPEKTAPLILSQSKTPGKPMQAYSLSEMQSDRQAPAGEEKREAPEKCPSCGYSAKSVQCPSCGSWACVNCSSSVRFDIDFTYYSCPKCGKEISLAKKQEEMQEKEKQGAKPDFDSLIDALKKKQY